MKHFRPLKKAGLDKNIFVYRQTTDQVYLLDDTFLSDALKKNMKHKSNLN